MKNWYAVNTDAKGEAKAAKSLHAFADDVLFPKYQEIRPVGSVDFHYTRPLFPRYIFAKVDPVDDFLRLRRAIGVRFSHPLVGLTNEFPYVVEEGLIDQIRERQNEGGLIELTPNLWSSGLTPGDKVRVNERPFVDLEAVFVRDVEPERRVIVLLQMLNGGAQWEVPVNSYNVVRA